MKIFKKL